jgi:hypothetical protein
MDDDIMREMGTAGEAVMSMTKYASALPRGYFDGLKVALEAMKGNFVTASRNAVVAGGDAVDAAGAIEEVVYDQLAKMMGFEDIEVVESLGNRREASVTVFNPQTDEASEITVDLLTEKFMVNEVPHEMDVSDVFQKAASINKEAVTTKKIIRQRKYKHGYIIRDEYWALDPDDPEEEWTLMERVAYTPCGEYIGTSKDAYYICKIKGIIPRLASPDHAVCSIGYNPIEKKWYGWSHRAMCGFGIGDMIFEEEFGDEKTDFRRHGKNKIETMEDAMKAAIAFAGSVS